MAEQRPVEQPDWPQLGLAELGEYRETYEALRDRPDELVARAAQQCRWIVLVRMPERHERSFAAKVQCFNAGLDAVKDVPFDVIGNVDADISFGPDYFDFLIRQFAANPRLGVAGTPFVEHGTHYDYRFTNIEHVSGACQLFRRECFDEIGGYVAMPLGGIDWRAVTTARMKGWQTRTFTDHTCLHHRSIGTASASRLKGLYRYGQKDYLLGGHPLWQVFRCTYQLTRSPYVIGALCLWCGYCAALLRGAGPAVPEELVRFHRAEQMARLKRALARPRRRLEQTGVAS